MRRFVRQALLLEVNSSRGTLSGLFSSSVFGESYARRNSLMSMNGGLETVMISRYRSRVWELQLGNKFKGLSRYTNF